METIISCTLLIIFYVYSLQYQCYISLNSHDAFRILMRKLFPQIQQPLVILSERANVCLSFVTSMLSQVSWTSSPFSWWLLVFFNYLKAVTIQLFVIGLCGWHQHHAQVESGLPSLDSIEEYYKPLCMARVGMCFFWLLSTWVLGICVLILDVVIWCIPTWRVCILDAQGLPRTLLYMDSPWLHPETKSHVWTKG